MRPWLMVATLALSTVLSTARADALRVALPDRSQLVLEIPSGWRGESKPTSAGPAAFHLSPQGGAAFLLVVTPVWREDLNVPKPTPADLRARVRIAADTATARSVEREIALQDFGDGRVYGTYFRATDRSAAPGDYARMVQGIAGFGEIALAFTLLSHGDPTPLLSSTVRVLTGVRRELPRP